VVTDLEEADILAAGKRSAPRGTLALTAPVTSGEEGLRPILGAYLNAYPTVSAKCYLLGRPVNLIDEGIDVALRNAHLPDSSHESTLQYPPIQALRDRIGRGLDAVDPRNRTKHGCAAVPWRVALLGTISCKLMVPS
jgi:DNA-binding transcriptional LysR family regulator